MRTREQQNEINKATAEKHRRSLGIKTRDELKSEQLQEFISRATKVHNGRFSYEQCTTNVTSITCHVHGSFSQSRAAHLRGQGCPACADLVRAANAREVAEVAAATFAAKAATVHSSLYSYESVNYVNVHTKVLISCSNHGLFAQTPAAHLNGQGCPDCANERRAAFAESKGEQAIARWLELYRIPFTKQQTFEGCRDHLPLRYDFYLPTLSILIEFDGQQHFDFVKKFHRTVEQFKKCQARDKIKNQFAKDNNITLLRIKYSEEKDIDKILHERIIEGSNYLSENSNALLSPL